MENDGDVAEFDRIYASQFPVLPGDTVVINVSETYDIYPCKIVEVGAANPEYIEAKKAKKKLSEFPKGAGTIKWKQADRESCKNFYRDTHADVQLKYEKSMWAVISIKINSSKSITKKLYTYELLELIKEKKVVITPKDKLK